MSDATVSFSCSCGTKLKAPLSKAGQSFSCPKCHQAVTVPGKVAASTVPGESISFPCSNCGEEIQAPRKLAGKKWICPHCGIASTVVPRWVTHVSIAVAALFALGTILWLGGWSGVADSLGINPKVTLRESEEPVWSAYNEAAFEEMMKYSRDQNSEERLRMLTTDQIQIIATGTSAKILSTQESRAKVEILEGPRKGEVHFVDLKFIQ